MYLEALVITEYLDNLAIFAGNSQKFSCPSPSDIRTSDLVLLAHEKNLAKGLDIKN